MIAILVIVISFSPVPSSGRPAFLGRVVDLAHPPPSPVFVALRHLDWLTSMELTLVFFGHLCGHFHCANSSRSGLCRKYQGHPEWLRFRHAVSNGGYTDQRRNSSLTAQEEELARRKHQLEIRRIELEEDRLPLFATLWRCF